MDPAVPASPSSPPTPPRHDSAPSLPNNIAFLLHAARTLLTYGRHLLETVRHRATAPNFNTIAAAFGTANLTTILAHLNRGLLRAAALERFLLARAAAGRDIDIVEPRPTPDAPQPPPAAAATAATPQLLPPLLPATRTASSRPSLATVRNDPELFTPSEQDIEHQVRHRPIGRTIFDICLDLAVVPGFCTGEFWNELFEIMQAFGGSVAELMLERCRRERAFAKQQDRIPGSNWDWLGMKRDGIRQVLGFFIGEPPVNPLATGPP